MKKFKIYFDCVNIMKFAIMLSILSDLFQGGLIIMMASYLGQFADAILYMDTSYAITNIHKLLLCIIGYVLILPAFNFVMDYIYTKEGTNYTEFITGLFLNKKCEKAKQISAGEVSYRLEDDIISFYCFVIDNIITKCIVVPILICYLFYNAVKLSVFYTLITMVISLINFIVPIYVRKLEAKYDKDNREYQERENAYRMDIIIRPYVLRLFNLSSYFYGKLNKLFWTYFQKTRKKDIQCRIIAQNISSLIKTTNKLLIILIGAVFVARGMVNSGSILAMVGYSAIFDTIIGYCQGIITAIPKTKNLEERISFFYTDYESNYGQKLDQLDSITVIDLCFSYTPESQIIDNLNFTILKGSKTAIRGENGCGKSTLISIISGLQHNYTGSISVNGRELNKISIMDWRKKIGVVMQNPYLFEGTVEENIRLGNLSASAGKVQKIMEELKILHLKNKIVNFEANNLSGGEKQKIAIARVLLKDTPIIMFDEPSNNMDKVGIQWLRNYIFRSKKTIIYISHTDDFIKLADQVITIK